MWEKTEKKYAENNLKYELAPRNLPVKASEIRADTTFGYVKPPLTHVTIFDSYAAELRCPCVKLGGGSKNLYDGSMYKRKFNPVVIESTS